MFVRSYNGGVGQVTGSHNQSSTLKLYEVKWFTDYDAPGNSVKYTTLPASDLIPVRL